MHVKNGSSVWHTDTLKQSQYLQGIALQFWFRLASTLLCNHDATA